MAYERSVKEEALRLRVQERLGLSDISARLSISKGTASLWLRDYPLPKELIQQRMALNGATKRRPTPVPPAAKRLHISMQGVSKTDLGEAVRFLAVGRLVLAGLNPFLPVKESTAIDILVLGSTGSVSRCQCKMMWQGENGAHVLKLSTLRNNGPGQRTQHVYTEEEVDFFLGYCVENDALYVVPYSVAHASQRQKELRVWAVQTPVATHFRGLFDADPYKNAFHLLSP